MTIRRDKVLMLTLPPAMGGVSVMARDAARALASDGFAVVAAHRVAWSERPDLSVPCYAVPFRRPRLEPWPDDRAGIERFGVGTWFPELEWAHHLALSPWRRLIESYPRHVVVTGNALPATGLAQLGLPALNWVATDFFGDRIDRFRTKPMTRRIYDRLVNRPFCEMAERYVLERTEVLALSDHAAVALKAVTPRARLRGVLRMPVENAVTAARTGYVGGTHPVIGFAGRLSDPRKNVPLLFEAFRHARRALPGLRLRVVGDLTPELAAAQGGGDLLDAVEFLPPLLPSEMPGFYDELDAFVISSHQEGLAIVGLEAMARGLPVISTRCGGPEEYVIDDQTGFLTGFDGGEIAEAIGRALAPARHARLSANALTMVRENYSWERFRDDYLGRFHALYARS